MMNPEQKQEQIKFIAKSEQLLGFNATQMHKTLRVHQKTYSKWRTGESEMTAIAYTAIDMLVCMKQSEHITEPAFYLWERMINETKSM